MSGAVIIGVGPGIGQAVARRFAREGLPIAVIARGEATVREAVDSLAFSGVPVEGLVADATDEDALRDALDAAADRLGPPDVVVYNAALVRADRLGELTAKTLLDTWAVNVAGAFTAAMHVLPAMAERGAGTFVITGGMPEPERRYASLSLGKTGVRTLIALLDQEYGRSGVHVAGVTVGGVVGPGTAFDPDEIAEHYWRLHTQPRDRWEREVLYSGREPDASED
ncbi:SDR family NAD(P)-dependent oxidoreductase [Sphaerisporangium sp. NPDC005288]|uniref:SDR family NAD(P)-dependent oxidoreductase n=1 Tax=Sphaerisporangium sp. NPDC005288 TaxID=3155114 RepID=UPI0033BE2627